MAVLARQFSLGDAGALRALLRSAGFTDGTITVRSYTVRQPRNPQVIAQILASVTGFMPTLAALNMEERSALAQAVEHEIGPAVPWLQPLRPD